MGISGSSLELQLPSVLTINWQVILPNSTLIYVSAHAG